MPAGDKDAVHIAIGKRLKNSRTLDFLAAKSWGSRAPNTFSPSRRDPFFQLVKDNRNVREKCWFMLTRSSRSKTWGTMCDPDRSSGRLWSRTWVRTRAWRACRRSTFTRKSSSRARSTSNCWVSHSLVASLCASRNRMWTSSLLTTSTTERCISRRSTTRRPTTVILLLPLFRLQAYLPRHAPHPRTPPARCPQEGQPSRIELEEPQAHHQVR